MIKEKIKKKIIEAVNKDSQNYDSSKKQAIALGISSSQISKIKKGTTDKILSDANWIAIARRLNVQLKETIQWNTAATPVYKFITSQLKDCQEQALSALVCDTADIGKTYAAKMYAKQNRNAVYIDCSQVKTKQQLVRKIAQEFGVEHKGRYNNVYTDLICYLQITDIAPLIILDEAGDLNYPAFLELKALWNAAEGNTGWYMIGADGLRVKIERNIHNKKVGYTEIFSRFGKRFQGITPIAAEDKKQFKYTQVALIAQANKTRQDLKKLYAQTDGSLRRVKIELTKEKNKETIVAY